MWLQTEMAASMATRGGATRNARDERGRNTPFLNLLAIFQ